MMPESGPRADPDRFNNCMERPLSILHYSHAMRLELGGVVRMILDTAQIMAKRGHRAIVATPDPLDIPDTWSQPGTPETLVLDPIRKPGPFLSATAKRKLRDAVAQADVVHLHTPWDLNNVFVARQAVRLGKPYIVTIHGMLDDFCMLTHNFRKRLYLPLRGRRLLERARFVQCTAQLECEQAMKWAPRARWAIVPCAIDLSDYHELPGVSAAAHIEALKKPGRKFLYLSRVHPKKAVHILIDAVDRLHRAGQALHAIIAGPAEPDYQRQLENQVRRLGLDEYVSFTGPIYGEGKLALYRAADVFVLPTNQENFGFVLIEAMACGTPVITTFGTDNCRELEQGGATIIRIDADECAAAMQQMIDMDDAALAALGARGRKWVFDNFDPERIASGYEAMYRETLTPGGDEMVRNFFSYQSPAEVGG